MLSSRPNETRSLGRANANKTRFETRHSKNGEPEAATPPFQKQRRVQMRDRRS